MGPAHDTTVTIIIVYGIAAVKIMYDLKFIVSSNKLI
jgi:hypothetical protein